MAQLNQNKIDIIVEHLKKGGAFDKAVICKLTGINPRYKSGDRYMAHIKEKYPELISAAPATTTVEEEDDDEDIFGDIPEETSAPAEATVTEDAAPAAAVVTSDEPQTQAPECPEGKSADECCGNPEKCSKKAASTVRKPLDSPLTHKLQNEKGALVEIEAVSVKGNTTYWKLKQDEIKEIDIQGQVIQVNLTQLEQTDPARAALYRQL